MMKGMNRVSLAAGMVMLGLIAADILMLADMKAAIQAGAAMREWMGAAVAVFLVAIGCLTCWALPISCAQPTFPQR
jgi:hypothetical protein